MKTYPIVCIPGMFQISPDLNSKVEKTELTKRLGRRPRRPKEPSIGRKPQAPSIRGVGMLLSYLLVGSVFGGGAYLLMGDGIFEVWFILIIPIIAIIISADDFRDTLMKVFKGIIEWPSEHKKFKNRLDEYYKRIRNHNENILTYNEQLSNYYDQLKEYTVKERELTNSKEWQKFIQDQVRKKVIDEYDNFYNENRYTIDHYDITKRKPVPADRKTNEGFSESYFYNYLKLLFEENRILRQQSVGMYYPDFVIATESQFYIDIEIDEPYAFETRKPTHYYLKEIDIVEDEIRDNFFVDNGWVVIRFTEKQILTEPDACCAKIMKECNKLRIPFKENCEIDIDLELSAMEMPTYDECVIAEKNNTREQLHARI